MTQKLNSHRYNVLSMDNGPNARQIKNAATARMNARDWMGMNPETFWMRQEEVAEEAALDLGIKHPTRKMVYVRQACDEIKRRIRERQVAATVCLIKR